MLGYLCYLCNYAYGHVEAKAIKQHIAFRWAGYITQCPAQNRQLQRQSENIYPSSAISIWERVYPCFLSTPVPISFSLIFSLLLQRGFMLPCFFYKLGSQHQQPLIPLLYSSSSNQRHQIQDASLTLKCERHSLEPTLNTVLGYMALQHGGLPGR